MKVLGRIVILILLLAGISVGVWQWRAGQNDANHNKLTLYGNVDVRQVELAINGSERIVELLVKEGDRVKSGQLLAKLETERFSYAVDRAKSQHDAQSQVVARLEAGSRPEEIAKAQADVDAATAVRDDAKRKRDRYVELRKTNSVSLQDLDDALAAFESAAAKVTAFEAQLALAVAGPRTEDIAEAKALLRRYKAELGQVEHDLADAHLYSPSEGVIQNRVLEIGDMASPQKTVYTLALIDPVWIRAYVSEPDLGRVFEGMEAAVVTDSYPEKEYEGWVGFISPTAEFTPKPVETSELRTKLVYQVRVFVKNPENELRLGMPATVHLQLGNSQRHQVSAANQGTE